MLTGGNLRHVVEALRDRYIEALALLEARIDFPDEEETQAIPLTLIHGHIAGIEDTLTRLLASAQTGKVVSGGLRVVLVGPPNAGKSTLFNALTGEERTIVTELLARRVFYRRTPARRRCLIRLFDPRNSRKPRSRGARIAKTRELIGSADLSLQCSVSYDR